MHTAVLLLISADLAVTHASSDVNGSGWYMTIWCIGIEANDLNDDSPGPERCAKR